MNKKILIPVASLLTVAAIGVGVFISQPKTVELKNAYDANKSPTTALEQKTVEDSSQTQKAVQTASETPTGPTTPPPTTPAPIQKTPQQLQDYAKGIVANDLPDKDNTFKDLQGNCFVNVLQKRYGWKITESDIDTRMGELKGQYPTMCTAWNYIRNE